MLKPSASQHLLAVKNGLLDVDVSLRTAQPGLRAATPDWFSPVRLPVAFDPAADCPLFKTFLDEVLEGDRERIDLVQEMFGYCLTFDTTQQKMFILEGEGANGKSVVLGLLTRLLGPENVSHVPLENFGDRFQLTMTLGKLANIAPEVGESTHLAEGTIKQFVGGDRMHFDRKGISPVEAYPTARVVVATNTRPGFADRSSGIWRRLVLIPFRLTIPPDRQDRNLLDKLANELPGILNWSLEGLRRLRQKGHFTEPAVVKQALEEYRREANLEATFLQERYVADPVSEVEAKQLYLEYRQWASGEGSKPVDAAKFGKQIHRSFPTVKRLRSGQADRHYVYRGLKAS
jgi:P4 family phage/plasmid primase-like protien